MKHDYPKLKIWQKAMDLSVLIYELTSSFPVEEKYGLTSQMRRAGISIPSNIAEGSGYESDAQFLKFLYVSLGSLCEVETQFYLAEKFKLMSSESLGLSLKMSDELKRMLLTFMKTLKKSNRFNMKFLMIIMAYSILF